MSRSDEHTGARIATYRKLRGLTQQALARQAAVSYSLLTKVESGHKPATPALIAACARVLRASSFDLTGQPYLADLRRDRIGELVEPIRAAMQNWDLALDWDGAPRSVEALMVDVARAMTRRRDAHYGPMAQDLPALIDDLVYASQVFAGDDRRRVCSLLADVYRCVHTLAYKLGVTDLGTVALERPAWCAPQADDSCLPALRSFLRVQSTFTTGRHDVGRCLVDATQQALAQETARDSGGASAALTGALDLQAAVLAAREGNADQATARLASARDLAARSGELPHYGLAWGPANVAVHTVSVNVDLERPHVAIAAAEGVVLPPDWPKSRAGHHWIDLSRAYLWAGLPDKAMDCLVSARSVSPQQTRYHPAARETVAALVRHKRLVAGSLIGYASWIGM
ncbi:helix-turn-helix domain-containing protein [Embleya sp. AB8]|uniref:helix-turn-helix domain-containing protein n=1 Tax=Embleya sp. AB8 TaxID=3156304 RepID=UPI003C738533